MPTYDYQCEACGHKWEHFQSMNSPVLTRCPECRQKTATRLIGKGAGVIFRGPGFYATDYRREQKPCPYRSTKLSPSSPG